MGSAARKPVLIVDRLEAARGRSGAVPRVAMRSSDFPGIPSNLPAGASPPPAAGDAGESGCPFPTDRRLPAACGGGLQSLKYT